MSKRGLKMNCEEHPGLWKQPTRSSVTCNMLTCFNLSSPSGGKWRPSCVYRVVYGWNSHTRCLAQNPAHRRNLGHVDILLFLSSLPKEGSLFEKNSQCFTLVILTRTSNIIFRAKCKMNMRPLVHRLTRISRWLEQSIKPSV